MLRQLKSAAHSRWVERAPHRLWLLGRADALFSFFEASCRNPLGGYFELDDAGRPMAPGADGGLPPSRNLHITARLVHAFGIASLMGRPGAANVVDLTARRAQRAVDAGQSAAQHPSRWQRG